MPTMPNSIFLAKLIGPVLVVVGIGVLVNGDVYRKLSEEFLQSYALIYLTGLLALTAGVALILNHNIWAADWRVIITVLGWLAALGGVMRVVFPQRVESAAHWFLARPTALMAAAIVWLAVGALLCFFGYVRRHPRTGEKNEHP